MNEPASPQKPSSSARIGPWGWFGLIVLGAFLACAIWYAIWAWGRLGGVEISPLGWFFLAAGAFFTILVGGGLMALLFYSNRTGRDI
jgi:predicted permease